MNDLSKSLALEEMEACVGGGWYQDFLNTYLPNSIAAQQATTPLRGLRCLARFGIRGQVG